MRRSGLVGGLTDQAIASLGNFGLNVLLARSFSEHDYGAFALILSVVLFLNTLHQAFVTFPLSVEAAIGAAERLRYFLAVATTLTLLEMMIFLPVVGGVAASMRHLELLPAACAFLFAWQLQEVWRRGLIARARYDAAIVSEFVRYVLPLAVILALSRTGQLSLGKVFPVLTVVSLLACLPLFWRLAAQLGAVRTGLSGELSNHWRMGAPLLGANILAALSSQWFLWLLAWSHDLAASAVLVALANVVGFSNPVIYGMENILVPEVSRRRDTLTFQGLMTYLRGRGFAAFALVTPFFLAVLIWPAAVTHLFYGTHKAYDQFALALRLLTAAYAAALAAYILSATLRGYRASAAVFKMQLYPALLGITLGSWLTLHDGVVGACLATLCAGLLRVVIGAYHVWRLARVDASRNGFERAKPAARRST